MTSSTWRASVEALLISSLVLGGAARLEARPDRWTVLVDGGDVTHAADPVTSGEVLLVDVAALAPSLELSVRVDGRVFVLRDPQGGEWQGAAGSSVLSGPHGDVPLARPARIESRSIYLPAATAAALAGLTLSIDREAGTAVFTHTAAAGAPAGVAPPGWTSFTIPKPPGSYQPLAPPVYGSGLPTILPPAHDNVRVSATAGQASGSGSTFDVNGFGDVRGLDTRFTGLVNQGPQGSQLARGYLHLYQPQGYGLEAGDLFSEIWGTSQGVRVVGKEGSEGGGRPAVSVYVPDSTGRLGQTVLAGREELDFGRAAALIGEAASDGSWLLRARYKQHGFGFFAYSREAAGAGPGTGVSGFVELPAGISVDAGWDTLGRGSEAIRGENLAVHLPLPRGTSLLLEGTKTETDRTRLASEAATFAASLGQVLLRARYQVQDGSFLRADGGRSPIGQRDLLVDVAYPVSSRLRFSFLGASHSQLQGAAQRWAQLGVAWKVFPSTSLQILATSSGAPFEDPLHVRLEQLLGNGFSLFLEYGFLSSLDTGTGLGRSAQWKVSLRKVWDVATPPGGGLVEGRVSSAVGRLGSDLPVELGPYRATTDASGGFVFRNVPPGSYPLAVPAQALPAAYLAPPAATVAVAPRKTRHVDLPLVPLGTVSGRVFVEHGSKVGIAGIVVRLDDLVTATREGGAFEFHNVKPGTHRLSLDIARLPAGFGATVPSTLDLGLPPGGRIDHLELRLVPRAKPILFQEIGR